MGRSAEPTRLPVAVVKLGGSLIGHSGLDAVLDAVAAARGRAVLVPGGGLFADAVREAQRRLGFTDVLAHRLAIRGMGAFAAILAERDPRLVVTPTRSRIEAARQAGLTPIWDASELMAGHPGIPETWDVTSDSLAAWLSVRIGATALILLKSAPLGPGPVNTARLAAAGVVDRAFPAFAARFAGTIRCLGPAEWARLGDVLGELVCAELAETAPSLMRAGPRNSRHG